MCKNIRNLILCLFALLVALAAVSSAGTLEDGLVAAESGDVDKAYQLWLPEAEKGNARAQRYLAVLYSRGQGVARDDQAAAKWFHKAATQGDVISQSNLGVLYSRGQGVTQDDKEAAKWFHKAAVQGDTHAQLRLGVMYDIGRGVVQNPVVACAWYAIAKGNGVELAQNYLQDLRGKMTTEEFELSQQIAEQLRAEIKR